MQINIIEIIKQILLDGRMVDGYGFEPRHPMIYNTFMQSDLSFEEFMESCLLEKAPEMEAVQPLNKVMNKVINIELSQYKALDFLSKESADKFKEKFKAYKDAREDLYALCQSTLTTILSNHIMFQELEYISNGKKLTWDQNTLSFKGQLRANKILELSDAKQDTLSYEGQLKTNEIME